MIVVIKNLAGIDFPLRRQGGVFKTISLKGGCFLNQVDKDDYKELINQYPSFSQMIDEGFVVVSDDNKYNQRNVDDTLQNVKNKQEKTKNSNSNKTQVSISEVS
ncbi:hypothetical protein [Campylobacter sp.]|uniref:hypothetical protein n=1 Tax=Campylobacter sp. TaxID=205 RepID=UPI0025C59ACC|nr:hypothetical protein [Campylobacter sp.]